MPAQAQMHGERGIRPATASDDATRVAPARPHRSPRAETPLQADRCANFRSELRDARRAEREAITTTQSDQASLRRQRVLEQSQKAGC